MMPGWMSRHRPGRPVDADGQGKLRGALSVSAIRTRFDAQAQKTALKALNSEAQALAGLLPASEA